MKTLNRILSVGLFLLAAVAANAQSPLVQTSLSSAIGATDKIIVVASATSISAPSANNGTVGTQLYVVAPGNSKGEVMQVTAISGTTVSVRRANGGQATAFPSGSMVLAGPPNYFYNYNPSGGCTSTATYSTPWINVTTGQQWLCSTITNSWVPGWGNDTMPNTPTAAVASAAGLITPSGPLFHITGTAAITGFNIPVGFNYGQVCAIPDGIFTTTTANNIALASTAVVSKILCWQYDPGTAKFYPAY